MQDPDALVAQWQQGRDPKTRDRLLREFHRLICRQARWATRVFRLDFDDAFQIAAMAFPACIDTHDIDRGRFPPFAATHMRFALQRHSGQERLVARPAHHAGNRRKIAAARTALGADATVEQLASRIRLLNLAGTRAGPGSVISLCARQRPRDSVAIGDLRALGCNSRVGVAVYGAV